MSILVVGHGSREFALLQKLRIEDHPARHLTRISWPRSPAGSTHLVSNYDVQTVLETAIAERCAAVAVFQEQLLHAGIVDALAGAGIACFGPEQEFTWLEFDKPAAKRLVSEGGTVAIPAWSLAAIDRNAEAFAEQHGYPIVLKCRLKSGRSDVRLAHDREELFSLLVQLRLVSDVKTLVLEQFVIGIEFSLLALTDGERVCFPLLSHDYPFRLEGEFGEKTGGMGSVSGPELTQAVSRVAVQKAMDCLTHAITRRTEGRSNYRGALCGQFRAVGEAVWFIEFDVHVGDPEMINLLFGAPFSARDLIAGNLERAKTTPATAGSACLCAVPEGYPHDQRQRRIDIGLELIQSANTFLADIQQGRDGSMLIGGGRSLTIGACGPDIAAACAMVLELAKLLPIDLKYRTDIGSFVGVHH